MQRKIAKNILLVEDNPGDVRLVEIMLSHSENTLFRLICNTTMADAIETVTKESIDVVLLEMSLPDGEGLENITRLKSRVPSLPIVVMTGCKDDNFALTALKAGAQDYLIKGQIDEAQLSRALSYSIERKNLQEQITHMANHDQLTGLANRELFRIRLEHAICCAERRNESIAVLYLDLDHFKSINDALGHGVGDMLLKNVSKRLLDSVREVDTVARIGGDAFAIILEGVNETYNASAIAEKIIERVGEQFNIKEHVLHIGCSVGIAFYPHCGKDVDTVINNADVALYKSKSNGRNQYHFYTNEMDWQALNQVNTDTKLRKAIEEEEFVLHYQPQFDSNSGMISGSEALIRWQHPQKGLLPPAEFIPLLEKNGLISEVGKWVLESACKQHVQWQNAGLNIGKVAVNLSGRELIEQDFSHTVETILSDTGINPSCLELELTESLLIKNTERTQYILDNLKAMGITIAIDDFGTGYNSFSYLKTFLFDTLKIDQSFIQHVTEKGSEAAITTAMISLAKELEINVVAEGVETSEQLKFLQDKQINEIQGFYFSPPVTASDLTDILYKQQLPLRLQQRAVMS